MAEPTITFGAAQSFGALTGWAEQSSDSGVAQDRAFTLGAAGDELVSKVSNTRTEVSTPYKADDDGAVAPPANIGAVVNSIVLTQIQINTTKNDFATMTLTGHNHAANAHADATTKQIAHGITLAAGFGAEDFLGGTAGDNADVDSSSITISVQHTDIEDADNAHLTGQNYNGKITAETVWNGVPTTAVGAGWDNVRVSTRTTNTGFLQTVASAEKALGTLAVPTPP